MINISVWSHPYVEIDSTPYEIKDRESFLIFIQALIDKAQYSGETICLEKVDIEGNKNVFTTVKRWP